MHSLDAARCFIRHFLLCCESTRKIYESQTCFKLCLRCLKFFCFLQCSSWVVTIASEEVFTVYSCFYIILSYLTISLELSAFLIINLSVSVYLPIINSCSALPVLILGLQKSKDGTEIIKLMCIVRSCYSNVPWPLSIPYLDLSPYSRPPLQHHINNFSTTWIIRVCGPKVKVFYSCSSILSYTICSG